jgi:hypothetical protein
LNEPPFKFGDAYGLSCTFIHCILGMVPIKIGDGDIPAIQRSAHVDARRHELNLNPQVWERLDSVFIHNLLNEIRGIGDASTWRKNPKGPSNSSRSFRTPLASTPQWA